ncbi:2-C-methyl-D-erythritol 4-phosphate cytidylyltransferase [Alteribacillus iranensis]|nr:2-C-methyl-D-erythritol 4-phosphate cytidylyltransferase [Alteribacillus iranensis]
MEYSVIIPAAGQGKRMKAGKNKQFLTIEGQPLIVHTVAIFANDPVCKQIVVVASPSDLADMEDLLDKWRLKSDKVTIALGGAERQDSVYSGLKKLATPTTVILVHDGARPFVTRKDIYKLTETAYENGAAVLGVPVKDTIKTVSDGMIQQTLDRNTLWAIQTPQAFHYDMLVKAYEEANNTSFYGTDDASLVERLGSRIHITEGSYDNIKITTPEDIPVAKAILNKRKEEQKNEDRTWI